MNFLRPTLLTLDCLFAAHTGASDLPSLGDASSSIVSPQQEHQLGRAWLGLLRGQVSQLDDPQLKDFVESSVYRLAETSQLQDRRLEFVQSTIHALIKIFWNSGVTFYFSASDRSIEHNLIAFLWVVTIIQVFEI